MIIFSLSFLLSLLNFGYSVQSCQTRSDTPVRTGNNIKNIALDKWSQKIGYTFHLLLNPLHWECVTFFRILWVYLANIYLLYVIEGKQNLKNSYLPPEWSTVEREYQTY